MLPSRLEAVIGDEGVAHWEALVAALPDGPLYHGTSLARATAILDDGFRANFGAVAPDHKVATYWGRARVAANFAYKMATRDHSPPAILSASLDHVLASGAPMALRTACDDVDVDWPSWRECHADTGSLWVLGGRHVDGLTLHRIHPDHPRTR